MNTSEQMDSRKPGRPKSQSINQAPEKKGRPSWKPASVTDITDKEAGYRYHWARKDSDNLAKKEAEGWETVSKVTADKTSALSDGKMESGKSMTSVHEKHDLVLQRIPEDVALERDAYMNNLTELRTRGLTSHFKQQAQKAGNAPVHGEITISSLREQQVID